MRDDVRRTPSDIDKGNTARSFTAPLICAWLWLVVIIFIYLFLLFIFYFLNFFAGLGLFGRPSDVEGLGCFAWRDQLSTVALTRRETRAELLTWSFQHKYVKCFACMRVHVQWNTLHI